MTEEERGSSDKDTSRAPWGFGAQVVARTLGTTVGLVPLAAGVYKATQGDIGGAVLDLSLGGGVEGATWGDRVVHGVVQGVRRVAGRGKQRQA